MKKYLIIFLSCFLFFGLSMPAFAYSEYTLYEGYLNSTIVGYDSGQNQSYSTPTTFLSKDGSYRGLTYQLVTRGDTITYDSPSFYFALDGGNVTFFIPSDLANSSDFLHINLRVADGVENSGTRISESSSTIRSSRFTPSSVVGYSSYTYSGLFSDFPDFSLLDFYNYRGTSYTWDDGPSNIVVGELPPQVLDLGLVTVEIPVEGQVVGMMKILALCGIACLALLISLNLLRKVLARFLNK